MRIEVRFSDRGLDGRAAGLADKLSRRLAVDIGVAVVDVFLPSAPVSLDRARFVLADPVAQTVAVDRPAASEPDLDGWSWLVEVAYRPGVTDTLAITAREALALDSGQSAPNLASARQYLLYGPLDRDAAGSCSG